MQIQDESHSLTNRINAIKELVARCPLSMSEDLLQDLALYKTHKDKSLLHFEQLYPVFCLSSENTLVVNKGSIVIIKIIINMNNIDPIHIDNVSKGCFCPLDVVMSSKALIQLFRSLNPQMLHRKDRVSC